jgi:DNA-binding response OmpR family regulator
MGVPDRAPREPSMPENAMFPEAPPSMLDQRMGRAAATDDLSYNELGNVDPDLSVVAELPPDQPSRPAPAVANDAFGAGKTVLIVDDEVDIRRLLRRVLQEKGFRVVEADRGLEALRMVKAHLPDLLVLDAMLPEVNGFEIARRIKTSAKYGHIPIVMVSAVYKGARVAEDAKASYGVDAYVEKPFRLADVLGAIENALKTTKPDEATPVARDPESLSGDAEQALNEGVAAYQAGRLDEAIEHLRHGLEIDPLAFRLHFHLGLLFGKKGMLYEAIQELEHAVQQNEKHFAASKNLAVLYQKAGFRNKAIEAWQRALKVAPDEDTRASIKAHLVTLLLSEIPNSDWSDLTVAVVFRTDAEPTR